MKTLAAFLAQPLCVALFFMLVALACRSRRRFAGARVLAFAAVFVAYFGSISAIGDRLLGLLEDRYPRPADDALPESKYIVVLGSGYEPGPRVSAVGALDSDGLTRIVEGLRIARLVPDAILVLSGGNADPARAPAVGYARLVDALAGGRPVRVLDTPLDTAAEAALLRDQLGATRIILVTSAYHMPRAMRLVRRAGLDAFAVPTGQGAGASPWRVRAWLPGSAGLRKTERALREMIGLLAIRVGVV